jgi:hypothetical protein
LSAEGKEKELQEKEMKLVELQEVYETRLLQMKVKKLYMQLILCSDI